ncbi:cysteine proteinase [Aureobasidium subglaciale]|nr:cysteine proteinase [Aureobasidium subglaciale]
MSPPYPISPTNMAVPDFNPAATPNKAYPHIEDLKDRAKISSVDKNQSLNHLLTEASTAVKQAESLVEYRRPDLAYVEYLRAFEIAVAIIPQHEQYPLLSSRRGSQFTSHQSILRKISHLADRFDKIKEIIVNDNKRNATRKLAAVPARRSSIQSSSPVALADRFAKLRTQPTPVDTSSSARRVDSRASITSSNGSITSPTSYSNRSSIDFTNSFTNGASRPAGPRQMPNGASGHPYANRMTLDTSVNDSLPTAPAPAYSPARNMNTPSHIDPPRTSARSMVGTGGRSNSVASVASSYAPGNEGDESAAYFPRMPQDRPPAGPPRRKSVHRPSELRIGPERLYDYLKMHSVLLIDVRNRQEFDDGHIYAQSIICIEPAALEPNMSAEQLEDALVLSPDAEQSMFYNRHKYDIVVYYDQDISSESFIHRPTSERERNLKYLYDALYEFNSEKPLQRPPILLMGGIEGWADLVGDQALKRSNTVAQQKSGRPIKRVPVATKESRLYVPKKRLRDYNPLDPEEERKWHERARVESVVVERKPSFDEEDESRQTENGTQVYQSIEEFVRRFPEAGSLEQRYGVQEHPASLLPARPQQVPSYPSPPPKSAMPSIPSRPVPAAARVSYSGVSDHRAVSAQNSGSASAELPPYVPPKYLPSNLRLPRTGLVNFGVTCYMNATIQALSATTPLTLFFLDDRFKTMVQRDNWKGSKGVLPELYANLIRSIWKGDVEAIRPSTLRSFCARLNSEWGIDRQQDAKEFFDFLVDCLHEDLNKNWSKTPLKALTADQEATREKMPKPIVCRTEWGRYTHREQSYLTQLFGGQHASRLRCTTCHFTSTTYEAFYSISVEIPRSGVASIQDCLRSYCAEERLSGDEVWKCPRCNCEREATKKITITRAPQFLVVHFKRFSAGRGESARKVRTPIDFPLKNLDMSQYMLPSPSEQETHLISKQYGGDALKPDPTMQPPYLYDAYAVMRHIGTTLTSGHYTCLAKDRARGCWRQFNDTNVGDFDPERLTERDRLQNEMAYIVFYERKLGN